MKNKIKSLVLSACLIVTLSIPCIASAATITDGAKAPIDVIVLNERNPPGW